MEALTLGHFLDHRGKARGTVGWAGGAFRSCWSERVSQSISFSEHVSNSQLVSHEGSCRMSIRCGQGRHFDVALARESVYRHSEWNGRERTNALPIPRSTGASTDG